jgi:hypothetical protein
MSRDLCRSIWLSVKKKASPVRTRDDSSACGAENNTFAYRLCRLDGDYASAPIRPSSSSLLGSGLSELYKNVQNQDFEVCGNGIASQL